MTTLNEMIEVIKAENPNGLRVGDDEAGYTDLTPAEYQTQIAEWAANRLSKEAKLAKAEAEAQAKAKALDKLTELGIDPKALGL
jgi:hypothetical protein